MVSVLMLTYNRENIVSRAIESVLAQTYTDFEFVIVDNGSNDNSGAVAEEYAKKDSRIRVIHRPRGSIAAGRNTALDAAKGDYIAFIDDDDRIEPDYLKFLSDLMIENDADMSICGSTIRSFDEKRIMTTEQALIELMWRKKYSVAFHSKMIRKELWENLRFPENVRFDDIALMYKIMAYAKRVAYHGLPKYVIYRHDNNNSSWVTNNSLLDAQTLDEYLDCYRTRTEWLSERFPDLTAAFRYFEWSFMISMVEKINCLELQGCEKQLKHMTEVLSENRNEFLNCPEILDFEREWMEKYIKS